ncbi:MAG TPA: DNA primase [Thiobacillaceae bacterium]|nr:DNA primase [Thiobacillaceae bacterium]
MIPKDFIDALLARVDIVDVVDRRVPLKKAGQNYQACCPFHQEKSPSFTVSPTKQFYHCFGCGAHGTAIGFLMQYGGMNFVDAVKELADDVGLSLPQDTGFGPRPPAAPQLGEALEAAATFYKHQLKGSPRAINYLKHRGVTGNIAARFGLGYAPAQADGLRAVFRDYQALELASAGLVIDGERGRYDRFRDRIMFPIRNLKGNVIGFGGRILDRGEPKYLNSPETQLFNKGSEVYGLFEARQAIRSAGKVVVVEGYMDVVALAQFGIAYAVATLGTATTPIHARTLLRHTDRIYYSFDGDNAGRKAAWRALENTLEALQDGKEVAFLFLPEGDDPDTYVRANGAVAFENLLLKQAVPLSEFMVRHLIENEATTQESRARVLKTSQPLLARLTGAPLLAALIRRELGQRLGIGGEEVNGLLGQGATSRQGNGLRSRKPSPPPRAAAQQASLYRQIARLLVHKPEWAVRIDRDKLLPAEPFAQELAELIAWLSSVTIRSGAALEEAARGGPLEKLVETLHMETMGLRYVFDDTEAEFSDLLKKIRLNWARKRYAELSQTPQDRLSATELDECEELKELLRRT